MNVNFEEFKEGVAGGLKTILSSVGATEVREFDMSENNDEFSIMLKIKMPEEDETNE